MAKFTPKVVTTVSASPAKFRLTDKFRGRATPVSDENVIALADSIRTRGQQQAVQVRAVPGTDEYEGIFGNTRIRAGQLIANGYTDGQGKEVKADPGFRLRAEVIECTDEEALVNNLIENEFRNEVSPIDRMENYELLRTQHDMTDAAICRMMGRDPAEVSRLKKLAILPEYMRTAIHTGKMTLAAGYLLAGAKDVSEANAWDAVWAKRTESEDGDIGATEAGAMLKAWRVEQKAAAAPATESGEGSTEGEGGTEGETTPGEDATPSNQAIPKTAKQFKDTFKELAEDKVCPPNTRKLAQHILDFYAGTLEAKNFVHAMMKLLGEKPPKRTPTEAAAADAPPVETPAEDVPAETPADGDEPATNGKGKGKRKVSRK